MFETCKKNVWCFNSLFANWRLVSDVLFVICKLKVFFAIVSCRCMCHQWDTKGTRWKETRRGWEATPPNASIQLKLREPPSVKARHLEEQCSDLFQWGVNISEKVDLILPLLLIPSPDFGRGSLSLAEWNNFIQPLFLQFCICWFIFSVVFVFISYPWGLMVLWLFAWFIPWLRLNLSGLAWVGGGWLKQEVSGTGSGSGWFLGWNGDILKFKSSFAILLILKRIISELLIGLSGFVIHKHKNESLPEIWGAF